MAIFEKIFYEPRYWSKKFGLKFDRKLHNRTISSCVRRGRTSNIFKILRTKLYCSSFVWPRMTAREEDELRKSSYDRGDRDDDRKYSYDDRRETGRFSKISLNRNVTGGNVSFSRSWFDGLIRQRFGCSSSNWFLGIFPSFVVARAAQRTKVSSWFLNSYD